MLSFFTPVRTAVIFSALIAVLAAFQLGLALGMPWGEYALGGAYPGVLPPSVRLAAAAQIPILIGFAIIAQIRAGLYLERAKAVSHVLMWFIVVIFGVGVVLNTITPSAVERQLWLPFAIGLFLSSLRLARAA